MVERYLLCEFGIRNNPSNNGTATCFFGPNSQLVIVIPRSDAESSVNNLFFHVCVMDSASERGMTNTNRQLEVG